MATRYQKTQITETNPGWTATGKEPPSSLRSQGFLAGYKPPSAYFNWFWTKVSTLFDQIVTVINKIQDYLNNKRFYIRYDIEYISTVGYLVSFMNQYAAMDEVVILSFIVDSSSMFSYAGISSGDVGELNCKTKTITFVKKGVVLAYNRGSFLKVEPAISDRSISTDKIDATLYTFVYGGEISTIADLSDAIDTNESATDAVVMSFDVGIGSLRSITHNSAFGMYYYQNGMLLFDNGYIFTFIDGVLTQKTLIDASGIADGTITKQKLSAELKAELGLN